MRARTAAGLGCPARHATLTGEEERFLVSIWLCCGVLVSCRQELVLIGIDLKGEALTTALDACLCSSAELAAVAAEEQLEDPFAEWPMVGQFLDSGDEEEDEEGAEVELDNNRDMAGNKELQGEARAERAAKRARRAGTADAGA